MYDFAGDKSLAVAGESHARCRSRPVRQASRAKFAPICKNKKENFVLAGVGELRG